ncbi:IS1182 family transposase [bacterium]|nr:IS1182 family transposase [bacterium]
MSNEINASYDQVFLFPPTLEELVPREHPARFIREFVDSIDLIGLGFITRKSHIGAPNYSSGLLLKVWLYGYYNKIYSTRGLERFCYNDIGMLWLTGMNHPDHNTLWRFFSNNRPALKKLFIKSVQLASELGLIGLVLHALDGTKIEADASSDNALHKKILKKDLAKLNKEIDNYFSTVEDQEEAESGLEYKLPEELRDKIELRDQVRSGLEKLDNASTSHLSNVDDDARMMKTNGRKKFAFNAQTVVDSEKGLIVGSGVTNENDRHQLVNMLDEVNENLGNVADETLADKGYYSGLELKKAKDKDYEVLVNIPKQKDEDSDFHKSKFVYDKEKDVFICPKGGILTFERKGITSRLNKYKKYVYRCRDYKNCPFRSQCSKDPKGRSVAISEYSEATELQEEKQRLIANQKLLSRRKTIVEPAIGVIKNVLGFRRFNCRGLNGVCAQWNLICTVYNLRKVVKFA